MKITRRQLRRIIKEEKVKLTEGTGTVDIFDSDSMYDLLVDAVEAHLRSHNRSSLRLQEVELMRHALQAAVSNLEDDYS
jgi:hypothetical protein